MFNTIVSFACICYVSVCIWRIKYYYYYCTFTKDQLVIVAFLRLFSKELTLSDGNDDDDDVDDQVDQLLSFIVICLSISSLRGMISECTIVSCTLQM